MKNILNEFIDSNYKGRLLFTINYIETVDVKNKTLLDVGCGFGWIITDVLKRGAKRAVGIEITSKDLKTAKANIKDKRSEFKVGGGNKIPYSDGEFDTVVSFEVLEHVPTNTENKVFAEVNRVLKKGGVFYLSTPYNNFFSKILDPAWWLTGHRHYSQDQLRYFAQKNGFKVLDVQMRGRFWNLFNALNMYFSKWILRRKPLFSPFFDKRENREFEKSGFATIFLKAQKL